MGCDIRSTRGEGTSETNVYFYLIWFVRFKSLAAYSIDVLPEPMGNINNCRHNIIIQTANSNND